jgi:hypothetical protein
MSDMAIGREAANWSPPTETNLERPEEPGLLEAARNIGSVSGARFTLGICFHPFDLASNRETLRQHAAGEISDDQRDLELRLISREEFELRQDKRALSEGGMSWQQFIEKYPTARLADPLAPPPVV